jgi:cytosine/adenosine deaminase-related metal-dependent hydrolase
MSSHPGSTVTLISAERLVDGTGREPVERGAVAVQGDRIVAVGERTELAARFPGATRADYPGATIIPGMVDSHVHITFSATWAAGSAPRWSCATRSTRVPSPARACWCAAAR